MEAAPEWKCAMEVIPEWKCAMEVAPGSAQWKSRQEVRNGVTPDWKCAIWKSHQNGSAQWKYLRWPVVVQRALTGARDNPASGNEAALSSWIDFLIL